MNFFCFDIKDFRSMDSITVYMPETKSKVKGVVTDTDNTSREITFNTLTENGLKTNINNIIKAGGLAQINHPNFRWSLSGDDLVQIKSAHFLEIQTVSFGVFDALTWCVCRDASGQGALG